MSHNHHPKSNIALVFFLNLFFTLLELVGGLFTNSIAILSDALHDLGDSLSLGLAWYFQKIAQKGVTKKYTYGYKRFSLLGAIINCVILLVGSIYIISEAIPRLFSPQETHPAGMFFLAIFGILVNGIAALRTKHASSINERVVSLHLLEDVLGWIAILIGATVIHFTGWSIIDPILSLLIACFVLFNVFKNIQLVLPILLQGTPADMETEELIQQLKQIHFVESIHDLHIWSLDEEYRVLTMHVVLNEELNLEQLALLKKEIHTLLAEKGVAHVTIEFEKSSEECALTDSNTKKDRVLP
ncbi:MAG: cation diffusion facilitator family transporter [Phocaeicola sp.]